MTDLNAYIRNAIRTEVRPEAIKSDQQLLISLLKAQIALGNIFDLIKKKVFYGKDISSAQLFAFHQMLLDSIPSEISYPPDDETQTLTINPRLFHAFIGIITESSEIAEALLTGVTSDTGDVDRVNILEELGDLNWYQAIAIDALDGDFESVLNANIQKLYIRYPEKFTGQDAIIRDLTLERQVLEDNTNV